MAEIAPTNPRTKSAHLDDLIYDAFYAGGIGGSIVALFFLAIDVWNGLPLYTPSMLGSVLFLGSEAASVTGVRLDMVAAFTLVHFAAFGALGIAVAVAVRELELHSKHPLIVGLAIFLLAEIGFYVAAALFLPGVIDHMGAVPIGLANLLAATGIGLFLLTSHRPDVWSRVKHALHVA
jgi:hypothetical protein